MTCAFLLAHTYVDLYCSWELNAVFKRLALTRPVTATCSSRLIQLLGMRLLCSVRCNSSANVSAFLRFFPMFLPQQNLHEGRDQQSTLRAHHRLQQSTHGMLQCGIFIVNNTLCMAILQPDTVVLAPGKELQHLHLGEEGMCSRLGMLHRQCNTTDHPGVNLSRPPHPQHSLPHFPMKLMLLKVCTSACRKSPFH